MKKKQAKVRKQRVNQQNKEMTNVYLYFETAFKNMGMAMKH